MFKILFLVVVLVLVGNIVLLDYFFINQRNYLLDFQTRMGMMSESIKKLNSQSEEIPMLADAPATPTALTSCPVSCTSLFNAALSRVTTLQQSEKTKTTTKMPTLTTKGEYFVPLGAGSVSASEVNSSNWKTVETAQATFDLDNYGKVKYAYLEVFLRANTGEVKARLLDSSTPAIVSIDAITNSSEWKFISVPASLSKGQRTYKVQLYTNVSTGYLDQARIRIVTQ